MCSASGSASTGPGSPPRPAPSAPSSPGRPRPGTGADSSPPRCAAGSPALRGHRGAHAPAEGERFSSTPDLGIFHAVTGIHGDILIPEDRLRATLARAAREGGDLAEEIARLLGKPWDDELETFR